MAIASCVPGLLFFNQQLNDHFVRLNDNFKQTYCCGLDKCCDDVMLSIEPVLTENITTKSIGVIIGTIYLMFVAFLVIVDYYSNKKHNRK